MKSLIGINRSVETKVNVIEKNKKIESLETLKSFIIGDIDVVYQIIFAKIARIKIIANIKITKKIRNISQV